MSCLQIYKCRKEREGIKQIDFTNEQELEKQRYGRNKNTIVNHPYIKSGEYRNKFNNISNDQELNRTVYKIAKTMLNHRSGTLLEDMYWIDIDSGEIIASETNQKIEKQIKYSKATLKKIRKHKNILVIHTHPNSMPPSIKDFNSAYKNGYQICLVCCHDGKVFLYNSETPIFEFFYKGTVAKYKNLGYDEYEAQLMALSEYEAKENILFKEV